MERSVYIIHCPPSWLKTPPLSLVYIENYLRGKGFAVKVRDVNAELFKASGLPQSNWLALNRAFEENLFTQAIERIFPLPDLCNDIKNYEYIGFSLLKRNSAFSFALSQKLREKFPEKKIIFGGPHTLFLNRQNKTDAKSFWVIGEGEKAIFNILEGAKEKIRLFEEIDDLDRLPFLDFSCLNTEYYSKTIPLLSSRGCKFGCNFCSERQLYKKIRQHSPAYVCDLIKFLIEKHKINTFVFSDSLINYSNAWLEEFCTLVLKNKLVVKWEAQMRVDGNFDQNLGRLMKNSGCYNLFIGLESASPITLRNMNKGFNPDTALEFLKKLKHAGLHFEISLIFGYPGETEADFNSTLNFVLKNKSIIPKIAQANPFIDYASESDDDFPSHQAIARIEKFVRTLDAEKIKYTKSFINNLVY